MSAHLADYHDQRKAFDTLFNPACEKRILMFQGESGIGKTSLLEDCRARAGREPMIPCVSINLKGPAVTVEEIFLRSVSKLGSERFVNYQRQMAEVQGIPEINIDNNRQTGRGNQINVELNINDPAAREQRRTALTEALFKDIKLFQHQVLFILDTYEQATTEVKHWISGPFLARVAQVQQVRILLAGRTLPADPIDWGYCSTTHELTGVREPEHWLPVVQAMGRRILHDPPLTWLAGVCDAFGGRPSDIMKTIEGLSHEGSLL